MEYRKANEADLPQIVAIYNQAIPLRNVTADLTPVTVSERREWFDQHDKDDLRPLWMIEEGGEVFGWVSLSDYHPRKAYRITAEVSIYLDHKAKGRGLGTAALKFAEKVAPALGIQKLVSLVFAENLASVKLFKRAGYEEWGFLPEVAELDDMKRSLVIFGKTLK